MKNAILIFILLAVIGVVIFAIVNAKSTQTGTTTTTGDIHHGGMLDWVSGLFSGGSSNSDYFDDEITDFSGDSFMNE